MIRSHSVSGDLHGVQPDPVAADILRKEPEHETFVRLRISPSGNLPFLFNSFTQKHIHTQVSENEQSSFVPTVLIAETPSSDEAEVYRALQGCLEMRKSYVFRESIAPWEKHVISDPSTPKRNPNPFEYTPETKSDVSLQFRTQFCTSSL